MRFSCRERYHIHPSRRVVVIHTAPLHRGFLLARKCLLAFKLCSIHSNSTAKIQLFS